MPSDYALDYATAVLAQEYVTDPESNAHGVAPGDCKTQGMPTGEKCVVVYVPRKISPRQLDPDRAIPRVITAPNGETVRVDVQEMPQMRPLLLHVSELVALASGPHQQCQQPCARGGSQVQPPPGQWVGTAGGILQLGDKLVGVTNAHVTGLDAPAGTLLYQPLMRPGARPLGKVLAVISPAANPRVDLAFFDIRNERGEYLMIPEQFDLGRLGKAMVDAKVGLNVAKTGRTTYTRKGRCVQVGGTFVIDYDGRDIPVRDCDVFRGTGQQFSDAGDSGSFILEAETNNFVSLLFAGGGDLTIGCPARHVAAAMGGATMYQGTY